MSNKNGIASRLFKGRSNRDSNHSPLDPELGHQSRTEMFHVRNRQKKKGSRRKCISPSERKRMETQIGTGETVRSAPGALDYGKSDNCHSIKSAPTTDTSLTGTFIKLDANASRHIQSGRRRPTGHPQSGNNEPPIQSLETVKKYRPSRNDSAVREEPPIRSLRNVQRYKPEKRKDDTLLTTSFRRSISASSASKMNSDISIGMKTYDKSVGMRTCQSMDSQQLLFRRKSNEVKSNVKIPTGDITIVITDVEASTRLWEESAIAMKEALDIHDSVMRRCYTNHNGYEITTEGDSFHLAFHHPLDALSFALQVQVDLYNAKWSSRILALKDAKLDTVNTMRGLRVRIGLHHGGTKSYEHEITQRTYFKGDAIKIAQAIGDIAYGGQIVTTVETWRVVSGMAERYLGSPQVLDCGEHDLDDGVLKGLKLVQLVPKRFAYDYFTFRGEKDVIDDGKKDGRLFPPLKTKKQTNTSFNDAPYKNNEVVIAFVYTVTAVEDLSEDAKANNDALLASFIRFQLLVCNPPGYECQEANGQWMLAFHTLPSAITFSVKIVKKLENAPLKVKIGIQAGRFTSQGPHTVTGRADYFGPVVNRAARVAASGEVGQIILGVPDDQIVEGFNLPSSNTFNLNYLRCEQFKGMSMTTTLYDCSLRC